MAMLGMYGMTGNMCLNNNRTDRGHYALLGSRYDVCLRNGLKFKPKDPYLALDPLDEEGSAASLVSKVLVEAERGPLE